METLHNFNHTGESMEENNKLEEMNTEPVVQLIIPRDNGQDKIFSVTRKKGMTLAGVLAVVFVCLAGAAGFYGWQYHHTPIDKAAYREYLDHKSEQEAKPQMTLKAKMNLYILVIIIFYFQFSTFN